jgi:hypothetical protein
MYTHKFICRHSTFDGVAMLSFKLEGAIKSIPIILAFGQCFAALMAQWPAPHPTSRIEVGELLLNVRNDGVPLVLRRCKRTSEKRSLRWWLSTRSTGMW